MQAMTKTWIRTGPSGAGQHGKMVNQIIVAGNLVAVCEGLLYAYRSGLSVDAIIQAISSGMAGSWCLSNLGPRLAKRNFDPGLTVEHFIKDLGIALREAEAMSLSLPGLALAHQLYVSVKAQGHAGDGTHALLLALEKLNDITQTATK